LPCFLQKSREKRNDIVWKKITRVEYEAINPEDGEAEAEDVDKTHD